VRIPVSTYRIQLRDGLTLDDVVDRGWLDHAGALGVSHLYLSPVLGAVPGSTHGYDVVDPCGVDAVLGGDEAFERLARAARARGMGLVLDIVPNHMAADPGSNPWWWDVLRNGPASRYAGFFDLDPRHPEPRLRGRIVLPVLDDRYGRVLDAGRLTIARRGSELVALVDDRPLPLSAGSVAELLASVAAVTDDDRLRVLADGFAHLDTLTAPEHAAHQRALDSHLAATLEDPLLVAAVDLHLAGLSSVPDRVHEVLEAQHHRLAFWRSARDLGYRRFFDVNELVGVRVERDEVFDATHSAVHRWVRHDLVDGLRVDHPDGLLDPAGYFTQLRALAPDRWIVAEKILEQGEHLPSEWAVHGTTGYDTAALIGRWFVEPDGLRRLGDLRDELVGPAPGAAATVAEGKRLALADLLSADLNRATDVFLEMCESLRRFRDVTRHELHEILREVVVAFPVYRTYVPEGSLAGDRDQGLVAAVVGGVAAQHPDLDAEVLDLLASVLTGRLDGEVPRAATVRARVEQLTGPAMAKGKEDTAFYRDVRLVSRCEVGDDPFAAGADTAELHAHLAAVQSTTPCTMTSLTTHDSKRSEDVRARLSVLAERPDRWAEFARAAMARTAVLAPEVDPRTRYLVLQHVVGAHPLDAERLGAFALKAVREAKDHTSWTRPDPTYEQAVQLMAGAVADDEQLAVSVQRFVAGELEPFGRATEVAQKVLQLASPGVADLYWGSESRLHRLVDPDNRVRPDLTHLRRALEQVRSTAVGPSDPLAKLAAVATMLELRDRHAECCAAGAHRPLEVVGGDADRVVAFARGEHLAVCITRYPTRGPVASDTTVELPAGSWTVRLGAVGGAATVGGVEPVAGLLGGWPAAALELAP
jgi:(1->4)-alpha-D-glucan 1-alpha-D-glucosylmutase